MRDVRCRYLPAEVMNGNYSRLDKADMFSLGATLYQLATSADLPEGESSFLDCKLPVSCVTVFGLHAGQRIRVFVVFFAGGEQYTNLRQGKLRLIPGYSNTFQAMLAKLMAKNPLDRPSPQKVLLDKLLNKQPNILQQLDLRPAGV